MYEATKLQPQPRICTTAATAAGVPHGHSKPSAKVDAISTAWARPVGVAVCACTLFSVSISCDELLDVENSQNHDMYYDAAFVLGKLASCGRPVPSVA